jgi:hypothetical protein
MIKRQYTLYLPNKPGTFVKFARLLAKEGVNLEGISVAESTDTALVQVIVSNASKTKKILKKANFSYTEQDVAVLALAHKPGALADLADKLGKAHVNINYIYATATDDQKETCVVVSANDLKKVEEAAVGK